MGVWEPTSGDETARYGAPGFGGSLSGTSTFASTSEGGVAGSATEGGLGAGAGGFGGADSKISDASCGLFRSSTGVLAGEKIGIGATIGGGGGAIGAGRGAACMGAKAGVVRTAAEAVVLLDDFEAAEGVVRGVTAAGVALNLLRTSSTGRRRRR